jgi:flagellar biosynthetic protein FlhB
MAEEEGSERTEEPTERKLEQAREKGQVPRSRELAGVLVLLTGIIGLFVTSGFFIEALVKIFELCFRVERDLLLDPYAQAHLLIESFYDIGLVLLPMLACMMMASIGAAFVNGGWNFSTEPLMPKLDKINPVAGLKRMFSAQSLVELVKAILKFTLVGITAWLIIDSQKEAYMNLVNEPVRSAIAHAASMIGWAMLWMALSLIIVVVIDVPWQIYSHHKQLRMTKQEVKEEYKDSEGKPEIKGKQRQRAREIAFANMMGEVPKADVVITNPTHYAVALKYDPEKMRAPRVIAKGTDLIAQQIRMVAIANKIVMLEAPPLARSLYYHTKLKREIPEGLYIAVAQVLAYVYHLKQFRSGRGPNPGDPPRPDVPTDLRRD